MRKASSILLLVFLFLSNVSFAHGRHGGCSSHESSCCEKKQKSCCEQKEVKSCCEKKVKRCHDAANCVYCQNKNHVCGESCHPDPCPNHHCDGCYKGDNTHVARADHHCDGCHPMDKW